MYNRYIPKNDGSYHRKPVPEPQQKREPIQPAPVKTSEIPTAPVQKPVSHGNPVGFLRNLLPRNFDTGDLFVVLLLLLMAGDCEEEQNNALLTLALYFFM